MRLARATACLACAAGLGGLLAAGCGGGKGSTTPAGTAPQDWPQYRADLAGTSDAAQSLAAADASRLAALAPLELGHAVYGQVVAAGGSGYAATADVGTVTAFDLATGAVRWTVVLDAPTHAGCDGRDRHPGVWGAPAVAGGVVYVAAPDGALHALDAATGAERWKAQVASPAPDGELLASSVVVSERLGKAYVGVAATAPCAPVVGRLAAVDLATHEVVARALAGDGQRGAAVWSSPAVDEAAGRVFVGTGNPAGDRAASPLAQAVVALDARTLAPLGSWQNPSPLANADFGGSPLLYEAGGRALLAITSKDGHAYALDRDRLGDGPIWSVEVALLDPAKPGEGGDPLAGWGTMASPALGKGVVYVGGGRVPDDAGGGAGAIWALDPLTGAVRFRHVTPGAVLQPVVVAGEVLVAVSMIPAGGSALELLDASTGAGLTRLDDGVWSLAPATLASGVVVWPDASGAVRRLATPAAATGAR